MELVRRENRSRMREKNCLWLSVSIGFCALGALVLLWSSPFFSSAGRVETMVVLSDFQDNPLSIKQHNDLLKTLRSDLVRLQPVVMDMTQQRNYVLSICGTSALSKWDEFAERGHDHLATELWKYCALKSQNKAAAFLDLSSPSMVRLQEPIGGLKKGIAILGDSYISRTIHGSFLVLQKDQLHIAANMFQLLLDTPIEVLANNPVLIPRALYALIAANDGRNPLSPGPSNSWYFLEEECIMSGQETGKFHWASANSQRLLHHCPDETGFCCSIYDVAVGRVVQMSRHPIHPLPKQPTEFEVPYNNARQGNYRVEDLPFISTVREVIFHRLKGLPKSPDLFDELLRNDCIPSKKCNDCLRDNPDDGCQGCSDLCSCYCRTVCKHEVPPAFVAKRLIVTPPTYNLDPDRLIPPIVHQLTPDNLNESMDWYPDTSRTSKSFQKSGWEYRYYLQEDMEDFLEIHFPPEVKSAYDGLTSDKLKLDLFRYCLLLIHGGIFVNADVLLESSLDALVDADIGFMVPTDDNTQGCLWQGFIASAPGHAILAKAIENIVNQVRNRYTLVDMDASLCPRPQLSSNRVDKTVAATGSCLLAKSANWVLSRSLEQPFSPGDVVVNDQYHQGGGHTKLPGRVVVLRGQRDDMGGHRLTFEEKNSVVVEADLPVVDEQPPKVEEKLGGRYDFEALYTDFEKAIEEIEIQVNFPLQVKSESYFGREAAYQ